MEARPDKCPECYAPLQPGAPFCGQCGCDLPAGEPGSRPRPEKCPFCSAPVEGEEPACRQCGFDFDHGWQPEPSEETDPFYAHSRTCKTCGYVYPVTSSGESVPAARFLFEGAGTDICPKCGASVWSRPPELADKLKLDPARRLEEEQAPRPWPAQAARIVSGCMLLIGGIVFLSKGMDDWPGFLVPIVIMGCGFYLLFVMWRRRNPDTFPHSDEKPPKQDQ
jgi:hypothetical protein